MLDHPPILQAQQIARHRHDLRTRLNQIIGYSEMIAEDLEGTDGTRLSDEVQGLLTRAHAFLTRLSALLPADVQELPQARLTRAMEELLPLARDLTGHCAQVRDSLAEDSVADSVRPSLDVVERAANALEGMTAEMERWTAEEATAAAAGPEMPGPEAAGPEKPGLAPRAVSATATVAMPDRQTLLIVDDQEENRALLRQRLERDGFNTVPAASGAEALELLTHHPVDLILLDVLMPGMSGIEVLQRLKATPALSKIPVIMLSSLNETDAVVQCLQSGAADYLAKPFNATLLRVRIEVTLERRRLTREAEDHRGTLESTLAQLSEERSRAHALLLNILPEKVAAELQQGHSVPMYFEDATICFTDFVGFTRSTESMAAEHVVEELHTFFTAFDRIMDRYGLEKMKTIGDSYMFCSGLPRRHPANPINAVLAALELLDETRRLAERPDAPAWQIRIGLHTGPVIAGVVGIRKFAFDIWGDSVNFASRMESSGAANQINISERTYARVKDFVACEARGKVLTKDGREVEMFFVKGVQPSLLADGTTSAFVRRYKLYFADDPPSFPPSALRQ